MTTLTTCVEPDILICTAATEEAEAVAETEESSTSNYGIQFQFAMLQLEFANENKNNALSLIEDVRDSNYKSALITEAINQLRNVTSSGDLTSLLNSTLSPATSSGTTYTVSDILEKYDIELSDPCTVAELTSAINQLTELTGDSTISDNQKSKINAAISQLESLVTSAELTTTPETYSALLETTFSSSTTYSVEEIFTEYTTQYTRSRFLQVGGDIWITTLDFNAMLNTLSSREKSAISSGDLDAALLLSAASTALESAVSYDNFRTVYTIRESSFNDFYYNTSLSATASLSDICELFGITLPDADSCTLDDISSLITSLENKNNGSSEILSAAITALKDLQSDLEASVAEIQISTSDLNTALSKDLTTSYTLRSLLEEYDINVLDYSDDNIDTMIAQLEAYQSEVGSDIQVLMVYIEDYMTQYSSYTQGASSTISDFIDVLRSVAASS